MKKLMIVCAAMIAAVVVFNSCQKDEVLIEESPVLKSLIEEGGITVDFPDKVYTENDAEITVSGCDNVELYLAPAGATCDEQGTEPWILLGTYDCVTGEALVAPLYFEDEEVGTYYYKAVLADNPGCSCSEDPEYVFEPYEVCFSIQVCREETAFGGADRADIKAGWMYTYTPELITPEVGEPYYLPQPIYADAGDPLDVTEVGSVQLSADGPTLVIDLLDCWQLRADCEEPVKVYWFTGDYDKKKRPSGKEYQQKVFVEGDGLITVDVTEAPEGASFVVHLCVESCELCLEPQPPV